MDAGGKEIEIPKSFIDNIYKHGSERGGFGSFVWYCTNYEIFGHLTSSFLRSFAFPYIRYQTVL